MDDKTRQVIDSRLARIEGQVRGVRKMVEADRYCIDILTQTSAVVSALKRVEDIMMEHHFNSCVASAMQQDDPKLKQEMITEVMDVISKFRRQ
ncbi:MAG: metal-sensitive transcriptional regulator [Spirochaetales bacterium]|jgi:DNA-binding FrmR family transcriptional regulator|nr:metal-sensitive transcriptional regulator [Spirochaetales bacterium]